MREPNWDRMPPDATHVSEPIDSSFGVYFCFYKFDGDDYYFFYDDLGQTNWAKGNYVNPPNKYHPIKDSLVVVGWQFLDKYDGKWYFGDDRIKDHRKNTEEAGYKIRDIYAKVFEA